MFELCLPIVRFSIAGRAVCLSECVTINVVEQLDSPSDSDDDDYDHCHRHYDHHDLMT